MEMAAVEQASCPAAVGNQTCGDKLIAYLNLYSPPISDGCGPAVSI